MTEETKKMGRPTVYEPRFVDDIVAFFDIEPYEEKLLRDSRGGESFELVPAKFPTLARFAAKIGVTRETLHDWATKKDDEGNLIYPDFSYAYKLAKDFQEACLVEGTMAGAFNATFSIFTAKNVLGWRDNKDLTVANPPGETFKTESTLTADEAYKNLIEGN